MGRLSRELYFLAAAAAHAVPGMALELNPYRFDGLPGGLVSGEEDAAREGAAQGAGTAAARFHAEETCAVPRNYENEVVWQINSSIEPSITISAWRLFAFWDLT